MIVENILEGKGNKVHTVQIDAKIADAVNVLNAQNIGAVVVVDKSDAVVGILSERDVIRHMKGDAATVLLAPIKKCMTKDPFTCDPQTTLDEVMQMMTQKRIRHMPVVSGGKLAGMVSIGDIVKRKIELAEQEAAALRDYIAS